MGVWYTVSGRESVCGCDIDCEGERVYVGVI